MPDNTVEGVLILVMRYGSERIHEYAEHLVGNGPPRLTMAKGTLAEIRTALESLASQAPSSTPGADGVAEPSALDFICYLIDHCEGEKIYEENLQQWLAASLKDPRYNRASTSPAPPPQVAGPDDKNYPFYELKFIMRVLSQTGGAPAQDWETAHGMAREIFTKWHAEKLAASPSTPGVDAAKPLRWLTDDERTECVNAAEKNILNDKDPSLCELVELKLFTVNGLPLPGAATTEKIIPDGACFHCGQPVLNERHGIGYCVPSGSGAAGDGKEGV